MSTNEQIKAVAQLRERENSIINFLGTKENALKFYSAARQVIQMNPALLECKPESLLGAFMECACAGLYPSKWGGEAWIIPYGGVAQFQIGYQGMIALAYRAGVQKIWAEIVFKGDFYEETLGTDPKIVHRRAPSSATRGEPIAVYACAKLQNGDLITASLTAEEITKIKNKNAAAAKGRQSAWDKDSDPLFNMWKKTAIRQLWKFIPKLNQWGERLDRAVTVDDLTSAGGGFVTVDAESADSNIVLLPQSEVQPEPQQTVETPAPAEELNPQAAEVMAVHPKHMF